MRLLIASNARLGLCWNAASSARTAIHAHCTDPGKCDMPPPMFLRARISKMLSVWALVASRPTLPWHPYGHRWSHGLELQLCSAPVAGWRMHAIARLGLVTWLQSNGTFPPHRVPHFLLSPWLDRFAHARLGRSQASITVRTMMFRC